MGGSGAWPCTHGHTQRKRLTLALLSPGLWGHLGSEPTDGRLLAWSYCAFQRNSTFKGEKGFVIFIVSQTLEYLVLLS